MAKKSNRATKRTMKATSAAEQLAPVLDAIFGRLTQIHKCIAELADSHPPLMDVLEEFYEKRKNVAIDKEVDQKLKKVLVAAIDRIDTPRQTTS